MYSRETELRHLRSNDVYKLAVILDDNQCWKKLMEIIPKELNGSTDAAPKYSNDHIRLVEGAIQRQGESRLYSQILFDEWGTSGRKHERPTLGVLLQLLVRAELFRAADFVAINFLDEPPPARPLIGPAARIDVSLTDEVFADLADVVNDSAFYPGTESLNDNANYAHSIADNNKDYYSKYHPHMDKYVDAPKPPPRIARASRLLHQQNQQQQHQHQSNSLEGNENVAITMTSDASELLDNLMVSSQNIPKFSTLMMSAGNAVHSNATTATTDNSSCSSSQDTAPNTESILSEAPIPMISILAEPMATSNYTTEDYTNSHEILPVISALNLNSAHCAMESHQQVDAAYGGQEVASATNMSSSGGSRSSSLSNDSMDAEGDPIISSPNRKTAKQEHDADGSFDENDEEDNSLPNLSILEHRSSNNDSSLTTVTGTSGDNSFDLNDCSSTSNDIPCALKQQ